MKSIALIILANLVPQIENTQVHATNDSYFMILKVFKTIFIVIEINSFIHMNLINRYNKNRKLGGAEKRQNS